MYKVFVNDTPIILTSSSKKENNFPTYNFKDIVVDKIIQQLLNKKVLGITLYSSDLENDWKKFISHMTVIPAAGGLV